MLGSRRRRPEVRRNDRKVDPVVDVPGAILVGKDEKQRLWSGGREERLVDDHEGRVATVLQFRNVRNGDQPDETLFVAWLWRRREAGLGRVSCRLVDGQAPVRALDTIFRHQR